MTPLDPASGPLARLGLALPAALYGAAVRARNALYDRGRRPVTRLPCTVVSVGNLTVGGTGKTPLVAHLAALLRDSGYTVGVLSRGYRRRQAKAPRLVSDGRGHLEDPGLAGDEPYLIARDNPSVRVAVGADRAAAARLLAAGGLPEVILLDDGFQHRRLARDLDLLAVDARDPWGNARMLPLGPLREPLSAVARADAVVLTRSEGRTPDAVADVLRRRNPRVPVLHCRLEPRGFARPEAETIDLQSLRGFPIHAFSGIARPERFEADLRALGLHVLGVRRFRDHHRFAPRDLERLVAEARAAGAQALVTTEKDLVRLPGAAAASLPVYALVVGVRFPEGDAWLLDRLAALRPARRVVPR